MGDEYKGHQQELMVSLIEKESSYGGGVTPIDVTNYQKVIGYNMSPETADTVTDDIEEVHGSEQATTQEITESAENFPMEFPKVTPNYLAGFGALALGVIATIKDEAADAYKHNLTPVGDNVALPSVAAYLQQADQQYKYDGIKAGNLDIASEEGGHVSMNTTLMSSGRITESSETFVAAVAEVLMRAADTKVYLQPSPNPASDIIAVADLAQDTDNISAAQSLSPIAARVKSWSFACNNNLEDQRGHGGQGFSQDMENGMRELSIEMALRFNDKTELGYYTAQTDFALEFNNRRVGAGLIDTGTGTWYWGFILRIMKLQLSAKPLPAGAVADPLEITLTGKILDDGTNPWFDLTVFNAIPEYLT
jgi:hypothetical protein